MAANLWSEFIDTKDPSADADTETGNSTSPHSSAQTPTQRLNPFNTPEENTRLLAEASVRYLGRATSLCCSWIWEFLFPQYSIVVSVGLCVNW